MTAAIYDAAIDLIRRGLPVVICDGKRPLGGEQWHLQTVTEETLPGLLRQASEPAIGVKLGPHSVIDVESDSHEEEMLFAKLFDGCDPLTTPTYKSTRGKHRLFRWDERFGETNRAVIHYKNGGNAKLGVRIGANGKAAQSVIPPSVGREWLVSWDEVEPAPLPDLVVKRILAMLRTERHKANSKQHKSQPEHFERARKYLKKIPPAVSGEGGHDATFHVACVLVQGFALGPGDALELLLEWNESCEPPWSEYDLKHKVEDAIKEPGERGYLLQDYAPPRNCTDLGNAERFTAQHGADVRFNHPWGKWLAWDGRRWLLDDAGEIMRRAKRTARSIYFEAARAVDKDEVKAIARWAAASERRDRLAAMIALAQSEQPIPIAVESLDAQPWLLNVENGTIDLHTGELREHRRDDFLTKLCHLEYPTKPECKPVLWLEFLDRIFAKNSELIAFVQRLCGLVLVGEVLENLLAIFWGVGSNGKSVFVETICGMLGTDYAMSASTSLLMADRPGQHSTGKTDLFGKRFVAANESGDGGRLSEETVKVLTSRERIRARRMKENYWEFRPSHTLVLSTNHRPEIRGTDYGIWRRIHLVPFSVVIPPKERDPELANKLQAEWPAILKWCVEGCLNWQRDGLQPPDEVLDATDTYRAEQDVLGEWLAERCTVCDGCEARAGDLYTDYRKWSEDRGERALTQTKFGTRLSERGFPKGRTTTTGHVCYRGVGLLPPGACGEGF